MNHSLKLIPSSISVGISWSRAFLARLTPLKRDLLTPFLIGFVSGTFMLISLVILTGSFYLSYLAVELLPPAYPLSLK